MPREQPIAADTPEACIDRELSGLAFARRVIALAQDPSQPLLERVKFAGIRGMIDDELAMKRVGGLRRQIDRRERRPGPDGLTLLEAPRACRAELDAQAWAVAGLVERERRPARAAPGIPIRDVADTDPAERASAATGPWGRATTTPGPRACTRTSAS